jgi:hypothetical protein
MVAMPYRRECSAPRSGGAEEWCDQREHLAGPLGHADVRGRGEHGELRPASSVARCAWSSSRRSWSRRLPLPAATAHRHRPISPHPIGADRTCGAGTGCTPRSPHWDTAAACAPGPEDRRGHQLAAAPDRGPQPPPATRLPARPLLAARPPRRAKTRRFRPRPAGRAGMALRAAGAAEGQDRGRARFWARTGRLAVGAARSRVARRTEDLN